MVIRKDRPDGRKYYDGEGNEYWSVTTLLNGGVPKQNLIPWAAAQASHSMVEELAIPAQATRQLLIDIKEAENSADIQEVIWERLDKALTSYNDRDNVLGQLASGVKTHVEKGRKFVSNAHKRTRDAAADAGTEAHKAIERHILGEPIGDLGELAQASFENFLEFEKQLEPRWEASELTVFNPTAKYAGTLDFIAEIPALGEGLTLGDIKTGKGVYPEVALQLAAYRFAEFATTAHNNEKVDMPKTERAVVLHLRPDSWELVPVQADTEAFQMFLHVSNVAWFTRRGNGDSWVQAAEYFGTQEAEDATD
jgi:hypothetical protein